MNNINWDNADLNKLVEDAVKDMIWNASVKAGLTIKSEVRMILKFDKETRVSYYTCVILKI